MGLLKDFGQLYSYPKSQQYQQTIKKIAAKQFLYVYKRNKDWNKSKCKILWGDQIQGHRVVYNSEKKRYQLSYLPLPKLDFPVMVEYGKWMFQMIPKAPYQTRCNYQKVVQSVRQRYKILNSSEKEIFLTIPNIPILGTISQQLKKQEKFINQITNSKFIDDNHITDHPRFRTLTRHIRQRRGKNVDIRIPIYKDKNTINISTELQPYPGFIYMDAMAFGMGMACLQCTFSTKNVDQARFIHDQLHIFSPLFLALTAATPILKGKLSAWDVRWKIIQSCVDDRTQQQYDQKSKKYQPKSRYSSSSYFISNSKSNLNIYNDQKININQQIVNYIKQTQKQFDVELDQKLLNHLGMLLSRDFLIVYEQFVGMDYKQNVLFQMINSTNWNSVRFKIPIDDQIGWRIQFRTMQVQLTADENSAFTLLIFSIILILNQMPHLNFYIPISKINQNFERAHTQNAIIKQKFYFRINIFQHQEPIIREMTLDEIFFGSIQHEFKGIFEIFKQAINCPNIQAKIKQQLCPTILILKSIQKFIKKKVIGQIPTLAQWMRKFVINHKGYKQDSVISEQISNDLIYELSQITKGNKKQEAFQKIFEF